MNSNRSFFNDIQTTEKLLLSSLANAVLIEQHFGAFLLPPPQGIYKNGEVDPCIINTEPYFFEDDKSKFYTDKTFFQFSGKSLQPISDINSVTSNVYDKLGRIIIPEFMMKDKERFLSSTPTVPYRGVILVELLIRNYIDSISNIPGKKSYAGRIERHVDPRFVDHTVIDSLEVICKSLFLQVEQFIGDDLWHIYYVKRIQFDIIIEKTIDYRIHYYNTQHNPAEKTDES